MVAIDAGTVLDEPPDWAVLERSLLDLQSHAIEAVLDRYVLDDGRVHWPADGGGYDDAFEGFSSWPLVYLLGGDEAALNASIRCWERVTEQFDRDGPGTSSVDGVDEYPASFDWMHKGEGHQLFYNICLAVPANERFRERATRFADYYLPGNVRNYDSDSRQLRGPFTGSEGPSLPLDGPWEYAEWMDGYHLPFTDVDGVETVEDLKDPDNARRMGERLRERWRGDTAVNLAATSLVTTAYLLTGEDRYREWVLEYVDAWEERTERNGGIVPDNMGPSGEIGETVDGKWYGGYYGWTWPHGWMFIGESMIAAAENAVLLDGDDGHLDMARSTMDALESAAVERHDTLYVPYKYGDDGHFDFVPLEPEYTLRDEDGLVLYRDGWFEFKPMAAKYPVHVWQQSQREEDRRRCRRLADRARDARSTILPGSPKDLAGNDAAWEAYLAGEFPEYPERILDHGHEQAYERLERIRRDDPEFVPETDEYLNRRSPVDVEGLVQCTLGGPMTLYNGGLLQGRIRHFDPDRERPGLPPGVAALVTDLSAETTELDLVNLGGRPRTVTVQAGVFGEHEFGTASYTATTDRVERRVVEVDDSSLSVTLPAGTGTSLDLETRRFVNEPSLAPPWDR